MQSKLKHFEFQSVFIKIFCIGPKDLKGLLSCD